MSKKIISHFFEKNNLPIIRFYKTPFEHLIIDNCFNPILIKSILSEFKKNHKLFESKVMGGRLRLQNHDAGFKKFLKENNSSSKLYYFLKNFKNFQILYSYFKASLSKTFMNKDIRFYFDYSIGKKGYTREPHRDSNSRVIVFIGYFNDTKEGSLNLWRFKNPKTKKFSRRPDLNKLKLEKKIKIKTNRFIFFPNSKNSYHSVSKIKSNKIKRFFCYGGYSLASDTKFLRKRKYKNFKIA